MKYKFVAIPEILQTHVEAMIIGKHDGETNLITRGYLNALPGIIFHHNNGRSPIDHITTSSSHRADTPTLFVYGQMTEPNVVSYKKESFTTGVLMFPVPPINTIRIMNLTVGKRIYADYSGFMGVRS